MGTELQYTVAYVQPDEAVEIKAAEAGRPHFCFGCHREMVIKRGRINRWHFAHKAGFVQCEKDNTLHEAAKAFICRSFRCALATGAEYHVGYPCESCNKTPISVNVAVEGASIASERTVVEGTRSDVVVFQPDGSPRVIIEIFVTHDLESDTKQRYEEANYPVVTVKPSWDTLPGLRQAAVGSRILNVTNKHRYCGDCREAQQEKRAAPRRRQQKKRPTRAWASETQPGKMHREYKVARSLVEGIRPQPGSIPPLTSIPPLNRHTRDQVMATAQKLAGLGFQQQTHRPTLFLYQAGRVEIYADLDSAEGVPLLYALKNGERECIKCLLEAVGEIFDQHKVSYRPRPEGHDHRL